MRIKLYVLYNPVLAGDVTSRLTQASIGNCDKRAEGAAKIYAFLLVLYVSILPILPFSHIIRPEANTGLLACLKADENTYKKRIDLVSVGKKMRYNIPT